MMGEGLLTEPTRSASVRDLRRSEERTTMGEGLLTEPTRSASVRDLRRSEERTTMGEGLLTEPPAPPRSETFGDRRNEPRWAKVS